MAQVPINPSGGLVASVRPSELPDGASPRTYDTDFLAGRFMQRSGLNNPFTYSGSSVGPSPGGFAVDTSLGGSTWNNPSNVLVNTGAYASANLAASGSNSSSASTGSNAGGGVAWSNPANVDSNVAFASVSLGAGGTNYTPSGASGSVFNAASPSNQTPGAVDTVLGGFASVAATAATLYIPLTVSISFSQGGGAVAIQVNTGSGWVTKGTWSSSYSGTVPIAISGFTNLNTVQIQLVATASCGPTGYVNVSGSVSGWYATVASGSGLTAQTLNAAISGLTIPSGAAITGLGISFQADYSGAAPSFQVGLNVGNLQPSETLTSSPATYTAGGAGILWGYGSWTAATLSSLAVDFYVSASATSTVNVNELVVTVYYSGGAALSTDGLDIKQFGFSVPSTDVPQGFVVVAKLYGVSGQSWTLYAQLLKAGNPVGTPQSLFNNFGFTGEATVTIGASNNPFGASLLYSDLNNTGFGVRLTASSTGTATVGVGYVTLQAYFTPSTYNFNYVGQFLAPSGIGYKLALDANGTWWLENTTSAPGTLTPILLGTAAGSYGSGATVYNRAFVANSSLTALQVTGSDLPRQYNFEGGWWDRITQVGPATPGTVSASQASGAIASITSVTLTGTVAQITASNAYVAGEVGTFAGITGGAATGLNGQTLIVLSTGLSSSGFQVAFAGAAGGPYAQSGATFTPQYTYPVTSITQPAAYSDPSSPGHLSVLLWSAGPGSTSAGNTLTVYYQSSFNYPTPDQTLVTAFNAGYPVYVYITGTPFGSGIYQVTSIGNALPPGVSHYRFYYTVQLPTQNYQLSIEPAGQYEITQATVTTSSPVPGLAPGAQVSIAGASVAAWNGVYPIVEALNSGAFNITQTAVTGGTATYTWTLVSGSAPAAGQLVIVSNTLNANGVLNVTDALIASATGVTSGTFTITGFASNLSYSTAVEQGQATTAGTQFIIDPGAINAGSTTVNPIYGNSTGGTITVVGSASGGTLPIGAGTRQGVWIFVTRNGLYTAPSPPITYTVAVGANYVQVTAPIGPPNVIGRLWATTQAGQNSVPGANFYTTTVPTLFTVGGVQYTSSSFLIADNVTTTAKFTFSDFVLLQSDAIDIVGNNLFNLIEIGNPAVILKYAERVFYIGCQNKLQNFNNLSFDGGYLATSGGASAVPAGWNVDANFNLPYEGFAQSSAVSLNVSPVFGNSLYVVNHTATNQSALGMITQSAYQDAWNEPILNPNGAPVAYSFRITARTPSGQTTGSIVVDLTNSSQGVYGTTLASATIPLSSLSTTMAQYTFSLVPQPGLATIPPGLLLRVWGQNIAAAGDYEIDRIEVFPTSQPVLTNIVWVSYAQNPEQVDIETGQLTLDSANEHPVYGATIIQDQLCFKKSTSFIECEDSANFEPAFWTTREVAQAGVGACGPNAFSQGADWDISLHKSGINVYEGGKPMPISRELQAMQTGDSLWDQINWSAAHTFWVCNDLRARRFYVGVAMNTPNFWLPNAPAATPTQPNVWLMCNYDGCATAQELENSPPVHVTMFGNLKAMDMRRKWSIGQIASPFAAICLDGVANYDTMFVCNGIGSGKIYRLLAPDVQPTDDGTPIAWLHTTSGQPGQEKAQTLQIGLGQKYVSKWMAAVAGSAGANGLQIRHYPNVLPPLWSATAIYLGGQQVLYGGNLWTAVAASVGTAPASPAWSLSTFAAQVAYTPPLVAAMQNNIEWNKELRFQRVFTEFSMNQNGTPVAGYAEVGEMIALDMQAHQGGDRRGRSS